MGHALQRRAITGQSCAMKAAFDLGIVKRHAAMQRAAIVPEYNITDFPLVLLRELRVGAMLDQEIDKFTAFVEVHAFNFARV